MKKNNNYYLSILLTRNRKWIDNASYTNKKKTQTSKKRGGLFLAQFPGKAHRSVFKVFSSIYWETFKQNNKQTTYARSHEAVNRSDQDPPPASALGRLDVRSGEDPRSYHPEINKRKPIVKRVCVDKYKKTSENKIRYHYLIISINYDTRQ